MLFKMLLRNAFVILALLTLVSYFVNEVGIYSKIFLPHGFCSGDGKNHNVDFNSHLVEVFNVSVNIDNYTIPNATLELQYWGDAKEWDEYNKMFENRILFVNINCCVDIKNKRAWFKFNCNPDRIMVPLILSLALLTKISMFFTANDTLNHLVFYINYFFKSIFSI